MIITFIGHSAISHSKRLKEILKEQIINSVSSPTPVTCFLGGYGDFDNLCACACKDLKNEYPNIEVVYITPYLNQSEQAKIQWLGKRE